MNCLHKKTFYVDEKRFYDLLFCLGVLAIVGFLCFPSDVFAIRQNNQIAALRRVKAAWDNLMFYGGGCAASIGILGAIFSLIKHNLPGAGYCLSAAALGGLGVWNGVGTLLI